MCKGFGKHNQSIKSINIDTWSTHICPNLFFSFMYFLQQNKLSWFLITMDINPLIHNPSIAASISNRSVDVYTFCFMNFLKLIDWITLLCSVMWLDFLLRMRSFCFYRTATGRQTYCDFLYETWSLLPLIVLINEKCDNT